MRYNMNNFNISGNFYVKIPEYKTIVVKVSKHKEKVFIICPGSNHYNELVNYTNMMSRKEYKRMFGVDPKDRYEYDGVIDFYYVKLKRFIDKIRGKK